MKRFLPLVVVALLAASPAMAQSPAPSGSPNWRPAPTSTFAALEAALVPVNVELKEAMEDLFARVGTLTSASYNLVLAVLTGKGEGVVNDIAKLAAEVDANLTRMQTASAAGLAVVDSFPAELCSADFVGVVRTAFLLIGSSVNALRVNDLANANSELVAGRYLFLTYAELERLLVACG